MTLSTKLNVSIAIEEEEEEEEKNLQRVECDEDFPLELSISTDGRCNHFPEGVLLF
jgi:hypothetical protein